MVSGMAAGHQRDRVCSDWKRSRSLVYPPCNINQIQLRSVDKVFGLGVTYDNKVSFGDHILGQCRVESVSTNILDLREFRFKIC